MFSGPPYIRSLPPIKVQSGQSVTLKCPYYGYPIRYILTNFYLTFDRLPFAIWEGSSFLSKRERVYKISLGAVISLQIKI